ncbi:hypothetical protein BV898_10563 [Hypsibius exemplaris]|uniref:Uncharacterized protein n=1 Tax=Hypsibius exemplaris TaxID=2072580 RepID=A0A1W0WJE3_HYPEX|nr:hypothetical protein BV898_10563 [Hypsibius exemplaris]
MQLPNTSVLLLGIFLLSESVSGGLIPRGLSGLIRQAQGVFRPAGGSRAKYYAAAAALAKLSTTTTSAVPSQQDSVNPVSPPPFNMAGMMQAMSQFSGTAAVKGGSNGGRSGGKSSTFNPADLLGQLAISFDKQGANAQPGSDDIIAQFSGMLPMILSVAKPVMTSYKGTDGYGGFMTLLQDAKQLLSNREVVRQLNQFLDDLIIGDATSSGSSQTPPTPSDSSLNSLAQIAQNMESMFNVPQTRPNHSRGRGKSMTTTEDSANEVASNDAAEDST